MPRRDETQKLLARGKDIEAETERLCWRLLVGGNGEMKPTPRRNKEQQTTVKSEDCTVNHSFGCPEGHGKGNVLLPSHSLLHL